MPKPTRAMLLLALLLTISCPGCQSPRIKDRDFRNLTIFRVGPGSLIPGSAIATTSTEEAYDRLRSEAETQAGAAPDRSLDLADMADDMGCQMLGRDPTAALPWFREAAAHAMFGLISAGPADATPIQVRAVARHNHAVKELLRCAGSGPRKMNPAWREQLAAVGIQVSTTSPDRASLPCDELWIAGDFRVKNLDPVGNDGLGVPLIAVSHFPYREAVPDRYLPPKLRLPATAILRPNGPLHNGGWRSQPAVLDLHDPGNVSAITLAPGSSSLALASDLTTPMAHQFLESPLTRLAWGGLLRPEAFNSYLGIFTYGPYQPGKVPVLFIHGLWSSPDAWLKMANSLQADPFIRSRYQFWFVYYPTGAPLLVSASRVRQSLHGLRDAIDPSRSDAALDQKANRRGQREEKGYEAVVLFLVRGASGRNTVPSLRRRCGRHTG